MKFDQVKSLIIIEIDGGKFLVDTGSPLSGTFELVDNDYKFNVGNGAFSLNYNPSILPLKEAAAKIFPGNSIVGIVGNDIISKTNLTIDYLNKEVYFGLVDCPYDIEQTTIPFDFRHGYPFIRINSNGRMLNVVLDSGAEYGYVKASYLDLSDPTDIEIIDYYQNGAIKCKSYRFDDGFHENDGPIVGILPSEYSFVTDGVLSLYEFVRPGFCQFNFNKREFSFTRRFL